MSEIFGYLIVEKDVDISTLPYENEEYTLLPGSIAYVVGGGAYMLTPSNRWQFLDPEIQKIVLPVFKNVSSSGGGGGGSSALLVGGTYDSETLVCTLDKTWKEIHDAIAAGRVVVVNIEDVIPDFVDASCGLWVVNGAYYNGDFYVFINEGGYSWGTDSEDGYPNAYLGGD